MTLQVRNVSYTFQNQGKVSKRIITNLNLTISKGEFVTLIGKSGTGKSTILKLITGLLKPDHGEITIADNPVKLGDVGYMPQRDLLLPWRTIIENILLATEFKKDHSISKEEAKNWLDRVGLRDYENALPHQLSGGMKQRAAFLRALLTGKDMLLLDEPFGALDAFTKKDMQAWLLSLWQELNKTVLFITHDLEEACFLSDRILILHPDQTIEEISVPFKRPRHQDLLHDSAFVSLRKNVENKITYENH
ncbi:MULTISPECIES: ABC transporter ATP-binding protein [Bacillus]|uniref:ABC transporter ATP-binding protein n=1 Tax=Bacillus TaxID=1386 RepID=UPI0002D84952|nr:MULTISPECIES: ABC transporter ATP-binding protein [Bacillus]